MRTAFTVVLVVVASLIVLAILSRSDFGSKLFFTLKGSTPVAATRDQSSPWARWV